MNKKPFIFLSPKKVISILLVLLFLPTFGVAETIKLKTGKTFKGSIVNRSDSHIEIDLGYGSPVTFYLDEIDEIGDGQDKGSNQKKATLLKSQKKVFLWKVQSVETEATVYLLGSIHIGKKSMYPLEPVIEDAFESASFLVVEVNLNEGANRYAKQIMVERGMYPKGQSLRKNLSKETFIKLVKQLRQYGLSSKEFSYFKPWFVGLTLMQLQVAQLGFDPKYGIDTYFMDKAKDVKEILDLESVEQQIELFNSFEDQEKFLEYSLTSLDDTKINMGKMMKAWYKGNAKEMNKLMIKDALEEHPDLAPIYKSLIFDRNISMTNKIKGYLKTDKIYFVVVGAGHLIGDKGIVELLRGDSAYTVEQL